MYVSPFRRVCPRRYRGTVAAAPLFLLAALAAAPAGAQTIARPANPTNLVNTRFATVSSGSQSAIHVDVPAGATDEETTRAVAARLKATWRAEADAVAHGGVAGLEKIGAFKNGRGVIPISTLIEVRKNGVPVTRAWRAGGRAVGNGTLTYHFTGWSDQDVVTLKGLIALFTPRIEALYGKPAVSGDVEIYNLGPLDNNKGTQVQRLAFGGYDASNNRILLPVFDSTDSFAQALLLNMVHAYHGPAVFQYDAWEQGFARAVASVIIRQPDLNFADGSANNLFSLLRWYDLLNQPGLGNPTFFPPSQANLVLDSTGTATGTGGGFTLGKMTFPRMGMSGAAWLKVYIENPDFFRQFNLAYYAQFDPAASPSLAGSVPALKTIAAGLLPNGVEGVAFNDWYAQQYVLDTAVSPGRKLYAVVIPGDFDGKKGQSTLVQAIYFRTKAGGDEDLLNGQVYATYHDSSGARLNLGNAADGTALLDGEGSITPQSFQANEGRLTIDLAVGAESVRTYLVSGVTGDVQAAVLGPGANGRAIMVTQTTSLSNTTATATTANAAFGADLRIGQNDLAKTVIGYTDNTGAVKTFRRNTGDGAAYLVLRPNQNGGGVTTVSHVFTAGAVPYFVSFPVRPLTTDIPAALNLGISDFLLSAWDPVTGSYGTAVSDPAVSIPAVAPGRGYWFKFEPVNRATTDYPVSLTGEAPATDTDYAMPAPIGWSMVGSPFTGNTTKVTDILVKYLQNDPLSWDEAVTRNLVSARPYRYDRASGQFVETDTINAPAWEGVFVRALVPGGVTLLLPAPDATTRTARTRAATVSLPQPDWAVTLHLTQPADARTGYFGRTASAMFGAARGARTGDNRFDRESPPPVTAAASLVFDPKTGTPATLAGGRFVGDFRSVGAGKQTWHITATALTSGTATLTWNGVPPRGTNLVLRDDETGETTSLRSRSSVTWTATDARRARRFTITAEPARSSALLLSSIQFVRLDGRAVGGGHAYSLAYNVSADAQMTVELRSISGRLVNRLDTGRAVTAGRQTVLWSGRAENGSPLPAGTYMLHITASAADGTADTATTIRPVLVLN